MKDLIFTIIDSVAYIINKIILYFKKDSHTAEIRRNDHLNGMLYNIVEEFDVDRAVILQIKNGDVMFSGIHLHKLFATNEWSAEGVIEVRDHFQGINATVLGQQIKEAIVLGACNGHVNDLKHSLERTQCESIGIKWYAMLPVKHPVSTHMIGYVWIHNVKDTPITSEDCLRLKEKAAWFAGYLTKRY